jgi:hypothetical protein
MMSKTLTAACVLLAVANFLTLAAEASIDDPPPAKQESSKSKGDATATAQRKSSKSQADDIPPAEQKSSNSKDDDPPPADQKGTKTNTDDPPAGSTSGADKTDDPPPATPKGDGTTPDGPPPTPNPAGVEEQTRGPVHEAFAEPAGSPPVAPPLIPKAPPAPIEEQAPNLKPQGQNSIWIPGYWSFDDEKKDYIWVSGIWRVPPPGHAWVPGHWRSAQGGFQWVAGFWSLATQTHVDYLPPPPPPLDAVPSPAPMPGLDYAPGCWVHRETHFLWRPGFWHPHHPGWIWIPATYAWTPAGCVFVEGYWDHPLQLRGLLFAPVIFDAALIGRGSFRYTPAFVVSTELLTNALFARPSCRSYYFGDYFGPTYSKAGYIAWFDYRAHRLTPDPLFEYYRVEGGPGRHDAAWEHNLRHLYAGRSNGSNPIPPRTLAAQTQRTGKLAGDKSSEGRKGDMANAGTNIMGVGRLSLMTSHLAANALKLERVSATQRGEVQKTTKQYHDFSQERRLAEERLSAAASATSNHLGPGKLAATSAAATSPRTGVSAATANLARPAILASAPHAVAKRTLPLRLPHEIVQASTGVATTSARSNGPATRTRPPLPTMPKPLPHPDGARPITSTKR